MTEEGSGLLQSERVESLRLILETMQGKPVSYAQAESIGNSLIRFYETLAQDSSDTLRRDTNSKHTA